MLCLCYALRLIPALLAGAGEFAALRDVLGEAGGQRDVVQVGYMAYGRSITLLGYCLCLGCCLRLGCCFVGRFEV